MDNKPNVLVIRPTTSTKEGYTCPWIIRMDRISAYRPGIDNNENTLHLIVDGNLLVFSEDKNEAVIIDGENDALSPVPWQQVHTALLGQMANQKFYAQIAVRDGLNGYYDKKDKG